MGNSLDPSRVNGKIVFCQLSTWGADYYVKAAGGRGIILEDPILRDDARIFMVPGTLVNFTVGEAINSYINSNG